MYSVNTLRKKALAVNLYIHKGYQHYMYNGTVCRDCNGKPYTGYSIIDLVTGFAVYGCNDAVYDNLFTLEEVEAFLKNRYAELGMTF